MAVGRTIIGLFAKHDLVDQARRLRIARRQPRQLNAGQFLLQALGQRHEVPYRKHMGFHETLKHRKRMYFRENRVSAKFCFFLIKTVFSRFHGEPISDP